MGQQSSNGLKDTAILPTIKGMRHVRSGYTIWHIRHVVPGLHITQKQLSYPLLNEMHTTLSQVLDL